MNKITFQFADETQTNGIASVHTPDGKLLAIYSFICNPNHLGVTFETGTNIYLGDIHSSLTTFNNVQNGVCWIQKQLLSCSNLK